MKSRNSLAKGFYPSVNAYIYLILCNKMANFFPHFSISLQKVQRVFNISSGNSTTQPALMTSQPPNLSESKPYDFTPQESLSRTKYLSAQCVQLRNHNSDLIQIYLFRWPKKNWKNNCSLPLTEFSSLVFSLVVSKNYVYNLAQAGLMY